MLKNLLTAAIEGGIEIAEPENGADLSAYSGEFKLRMPKSPHRILAVHAKKDGMSMNQYCVCLLAENDAAHRDSGVAL